MSVQKFTVLFEEYMQARAETDAHLLEDTYEAHTLNEYMGYDYRIEDRKVGRPGRPRKLTDEEVDAKNRVRVAEWREKNPERTAAMFSRYYVKNRDAILAKQRAKYAERRAKEKEE